MAVRLVLVDEVAQTRWRNGGGTTRELLAWPNEGEWRIRVSVADVEADGPFSSFPGVERWFTVLEGHGVELTVDGATHRLTAGAAPLRFDGESPATCRLLDGPTRDLNLMLRGMHGGMFAAVAAQPWRPQAAQCGLFAAVGGRCVADTELVVPARSLLWFDDAPASLSFLPTEAAALNIGWWLAATPTGAAGGA